MVPGATPPCRPVEVIPRVVLAGCGSGGSAAPPLRYQPLQQVPEPPRRHGGTAGIMQAFGINKWRVSLATLSHCLMISCTHYRLSLLIKLPHKIRYFSGNYPSTVFPKTFITNFQNELCTKNSARGVRRLDTGCCTTSIPGS